MPIKPENVARYPKNWKTIRAQILERAGHKCEKCDIANYAVVQWRNGKWADAIWGGKYSDARKIAAEQSGGLEPGDPKWVVIVLTVAHLDHTPENCAPSNLLALCQRCHLAYDHSHHQANAYQTRRKGRAVADLFDVAE